MVKIAPPPPLVQPKPRFYKLEKDIELVKIFLPQYSPTAVSFRFHGPYSRFDHHQGNPPCVDYDARECKPCKDAKRGISYLAFTLSGCLVEVFGDQGCVEITDKYKIAILTSKKDLKLLDVRDNGAMLAGANEATLAKTDKRSVSQAWSRYFYEQKAIYSDIHGIIYRNAHNNEEAIALYERAKRLLTCLPKDVLPLGDQSLRGVILEAAQENNLTVISNWLTFTNLQDYRKNTCTYASVKK